VRACVCVCVYVSMFANLVGSAFATSDRQTHF